MVAVVSLLVILTLSMIASRIATVALTMTGLSKQSAKFQARSAFTGTGFTTSESEKVVNHPVRRKIIMLIMLIRNGGILSIFATLMLSFLDIQDTSNGLLRLGLLIAGLALLWTFASSKIVTKWMENKIGAALQKLTPIQARDYDALLHLTGDYRVAELHVEPGDWIAGRTLSKMRLDDEGVLVLGIQRASGEFLGAPRGDKSARPGDVLILYGRQDSIDDLDQRTSDPRGNFAHLDAVAEHRERVTEEEERDEEQNSNAA